MLKVKNFLCTLTMIGAIVLSTVNVQASSVPTIGQFPNLNATGYYEVKANSAPVKNGADSSSATVDTFEKGETFYATANAGYGLNKYLEVDSVDGVCYGFIESKYCKEHKHSFTKVYSENGTKIKACKCGYSEVSNSAGVLRIDCQSTMCRFLAGNYSSSELTDKDKAILTAIDVVELVSCGTAETNPVSAGVCLTTTIYSLIASSRDLTADVYYCMSDDCNVGNLLVDGIGVVSGTASLHVQVAKIRGLDTNRGVKAVNNFLNEGHNGTPALSDQITAATNIDRWTDYNSGEQIDASHCNTALMCCYP